MPVDTLFVVDFREACATSGCPFCALRLQRVRRYLSRLLYEYATAPDMHARLAASRGFCARHAALASEVLRTERTDGVPVALLYESVVAGALASLEEARRRTRRGRTASRAVRLVQALEAQGPCPPCEFERNADTDAVRLLVQELEQDQGRGPLARAYRESAGACMPHLARLARECTADASLDWLLDHAQAAMVRLASELTAYIDKHGLDRRHEPLGEERDCWIRAMERFAGRLDTHQRGITEEAESS